MHRYIELVSGRFLAFLVSTYPLPASVITLFSFDHLFYKPPLSLPTLNLSCIVLILNSVYVAYFVAALVELYICQHAKH